MKIKFLAVLGLAAIAGVAGCKSAANTNTAVVTNTTTTTTNTNMTASTPMTMPTTAAADPTAKAAVEAAMKKAGFNDVTVEATANEVTLRGTVAKGKLGEAVRIANETGKRKLNNQLTEK
jgi:hypothetical protein